MANLSRRRSDHLPSWVLPAFYILFVAFSILFVVVYVRHVDRVAQHKQEIVNQKVAIANHRLFVSEVDSCQRNAQVRAVLDEFHFATRSFIETAAAVRAHSGNLRVARIYRAYASHIHTVPVPGTRGYPSCRYLVLHHLALPKTNDGRYKKLQG